MFFNFANSLTQAKKLSSSFLSNWSSHFCPLLAQIAFRRLRILIVKGAKGPNWSNTDATNESTARWVTFPGTLLSAPRQTSRVSSSTCHCMPRSDEVWGSASKVLFLASDLSPSRMFPVTTSSFQINFNRLNLPNFRTVLTSLSTWIASFTVATNFAKSSM